ncbi:MAG: hypothetical protein ACXVJ7_17505 [Acidimicrobiia bacterium]
MIGVAIATVVLLAVALVVAVARDPGPTPTDVAVGFARAFGTGDFDAMYSMIDPDLLKGRNRTEWIAAERARPHTAFAPDDVRAVASEDDGETARVDVALDPGRVVPIELARRQRVWTVVRFDGNDVARTPAR